MARRTTEERGRRYPYLPAPLAEFLETELAGGVLLLAAAIVALLWANSGWQAGYFDLWSEHLTIGLGDAMIELTLREWVNDGLMAIFFFVVGLEIKRELVTGELRDPRRAALPAIAALGGMLVPAACYLAFNAGGVGSDGWGIPMATDIAFAVGVLSIAGRRAPRGLKLFLLTLAIVDDLGAILVIAVFYTEQLQLGWLAGAAAAVGLVVLMQKLGVHQPALYIVPALAMWLCTHESGVHATIAGVATGLLTPAHPFRGRDIIPRLEHAFLPWSSYLVVPLFALANAGVVLSASVIDDAATSSVTLGVFVGLVAGKAVGVTATTLGAARLGLGRMPEGMSARHVLPVGLLAGIGFTVALFVAELSFAADEVLLDQAKIGILTASVLAGVLGSVALSFVVRRTEASPEPHERLPL